MKTLFVVLAIIVALGPSTGEAQNRRRAVAPFERQTVLWRNKVLGRAQPEQRRYIVVITDPKRSSVSPKLRDDALAARTRLASKQILNVLNRKDLRAQTEVIGYGWQGAISLRVVEKRPGAAKRLLKRLPWVEGVAKRTIMREMNVPYLDYPVTLSYLGIRPPAPSVLGISGQRTGAKTHAQ